MPLVWSQQPSNVVLIAKITFRTLLSFADLRPKRDRALTAKHQNRTHQCILENGLRRQSSNRAPSGWRTHLISCQALTRYRVANPCASLVAVHESAYGTKRTW